MKPLAEMNLVDDFLAHSLASHKTYGEEASRFILECILQRRVRHLTVVSQKTWYGEASQVHGVRLDLYLDEEDGVRDALRQITERRYETVLSNRGITPEQIRKYGFAFEGGPCADWAGYVF